MGFFSWIRDKVESAVEWVSDRIDDLKNLFGRRKYDNDDIEDQVDTDAELAKFRESIKPKMNRVEQYCMDSFYSLFDDLKEKTKTKFPDLVEIIENEQKDAERELEGSVMRYVKEHMSKNDAVFVGVLGMSPGESKKARLGESIENILDDAEAQFNSKLKEYVEHLLTEFNSRLEGRILDQEKQMNDRISELEALNIEAEKGQIDVEAMRDGGTPIMEASECIIGVLKMEI